MKKKFNIEAHKLQPGDIVCAPTLSLYKHALVISVFTNAVHYSAEPRTTVTMLLTSGKVAQRAFRSDWTFTLLRCHLH